MTQPNQINSIPTPHQAVPAETLQGILQNDTTLETASNDKNWLARHAGKLGVAAFIASGALLLTHHDDVSKLEQGIKDHAPAAIGVFGTTEGAAWGGAGLMLLSTGKKVGNPFTVKKRLASIRAELDDNKLYRMGWVLGALGAAGTSATVAIGAATMLPTSTWPAAAVVSIGSLSFSTIPFKPSKRETQ